MHSPKQTLILVLMLCFLLPSFAAARQLGLSPYRAQFSAPAFEQAATDETAAPIVTGKKNVGRAVMFSLVVPGTGQLYAGSWLRAVPWLAIEVAGWALFSQYHAQGTDKTDEFEAFAGPFQNRDSTAGHFNLDAYMLREYQVASNPQWSSTPYDGESLTTWNNEDWLTRQSHLPAPYTHDILTDDQQQYYEMIGKYYEQFGYGWNDTYDHSVPLNDSAPETIWGVSGDDVATSWFDGNSPMFFAYRDMRGEANDLLEKGNTMMEIVLVNHVLSALDAAFAVRSFNRKLESATMGSLDMRYDLLHTREGDQIRQLTLSVALPVIR